MDAERWMRPRSVAVVGASPKPGSVGQVVLDAIRRGGFTGTICPVNPKYPHIDGLKSYATALDLPEVPDLAIVVTPPEVVPQVIGQLAQRGTAAAVVITAGLSAAEKADMLACRGAMRIIGPNTIGLISPYVALNASFALGPASPGRLGLISQSGAIVASIMDWATAEGIGFSEILSLGDMADLDAGEAIGLLARDPATSAILLYLESITHPRRFIAEARAAAALKPVIIVKPGRHQAAAKAAATHTGALAGADPVIDAALARAGVIRVNDLSDLFTAAEITARYAPLERGRVAIITNGGGAGVLAVDDLLDLNQSLAILSPETLHALDAILPPTWSKSNPVDIIGDAPPERYGAALEVVARDPGVDAILVMNCPTALANPEAAAKAVAGRVTAGLISGKPVLATFLGKTAAEPARAILRDAGLATLDTPKQAAEAVALLCRWHALRRLAVRRPAVAPAPGDRAAALMVLKAVAAEGRRVLTEPEARAVLLAYGISGPRLVVAKNPADVEIAAAGLLFGTRRLVVKLLSRSITHKSDVGGVVLNIETAVEARAAAEAIAARVAAADLDGFTIEDMIHRPGAESLIIGLSTDPQFGPVLVFGAGGTAVEVMRDTATGLVPLDGLLAGDMIDRTRIGLLLKGYRDVKPADRQAIIGAMLGLSQLAVDCPAIIAADINPLLADALGVVALDARIEIDLALIDTRGPNPGLVFVT